MEKEFNLSDEIRKWKADGDIDNRMIRYTFGWKDLDDLDNILKEFIRLLKEELVTNNDDYWAIEIIDKLAGDL